MSTRLFSFSIQACSLRLENALLNWSEVVSILVRNLMQYFILNIIKLGIKSFPKSIFPWSRVPFVISSHIPSGRRLYDDPRGQLGAGEHPSHTTSLRVQRPVGPRRKPGPRYWWWLPFRARACMVSPLLIAYLSLSRTSKTQKHITSNPRVSSYLKYPLLSVSSSTNFFLNAHLSQSSSEMLTLCCWQCVRAERLWARILSRLSPKYGLNIKCFPIGWSEHLAPSWESSLGKLWILTRLVRRSDSLWALRFYSQAQLSAHSSLPQCRYLLL